jgi:hypothetical protein
MLTTVAPPMSTSHSTTRATAPPAFPHRKWSDFKYFFLIFVKLIFILDYSLKKQYILKFPSKFYQTVNWVGRNQPI